MAKIFSIALPKGGVGKTTIAFNMAAGMAQFGYRVLAVDLDPQANLSTCFGIKDPERGSHELFYSDDPLAKFITKVETDHYSIDLIAGSFDGNNLEWQIKASDPTEAILHFKKQLQSYDGDFIVIDCPPAITTQTVGALFSCDIVLLPVTTEDLSIEGVNAIQRLFAENPALGNKPQWVIPTKYMARQVVHQDILEKLQQAYPESIYPAINTSVAIGESLPEGKTAWDYMPRNPVALKLKSIVEDVINV